MKRLFLLSLVLAAPAAFAQQFDEPDEEIIDGRQVIRPAVEEHIFDGVKVEGTFVGPGGTLVIDRPQAVFNPLIKLRANFDDEMAHSVEAVR